MIIYKNTVLGFRNEVDTNKITERVVEAYLQIRGRKFSHGEISSINNSMSFMEKIVRKANIADDCGVLVEYIIPTTANRVDFIISGQDAKGNKKFIIIELKQWQQASSTDWDGIVKTFLGGAQHETTHPSYQAASYKQFLQDCNEHIHSGELQPFACAYLHNYTEQQEEPLKADIYKNIIEDTPIYFKDDHGKLEYFIKTHVGNGKGMDILYEIESGKIRPSKKLIDHVTGMFEGNEEFVLLDEQKISFEAARNIAKKIPKKSVVIIQGGPGTGKSVISVNLLGSLLKDHINTVFVAPNAAFRHTLVHKLAKNNQRNRLQLLFKGSASFHEVAENTYDVIVIDEAHRLKDKTAYQYYGENHVEDIIKATHTSIFFIDDDQSIRPEDIGSVTEIKRLAEKYNATIYQRELSSQFRCAGADGFLNWLTDILQIRETANFDGWEKEAFEFKMFDSPNELRVAIKQKHDAGFNARILAGYAWKWTAAEAGNNHAEVADVEIPEFEFRMPWNSRKVGTTWAIDPAGIGQIGCVHTSQGLEFDYVGVIVGKDLKYDSSKGTFYTDWDEYKDASGKKGLKEDPEKLNLYVRRIYKILMSRGIKGCYVYFMDKEVERYNKWTLWLKSQSILPQRHTFFIHSGL